MAPTAPAQDAMVWPSRALSRTSAAYVVVMAPLALAVMAVQHSWTSVGSAAAITAPAVTATVCQTGTLSSTPVAYVMETAAHAQTALVFQTVLPSSMPVVYVEERARAASLPRGALETTRRGSLP